jgi:hypothetical protein
VELKNRKQEYYHGLLLSETDFTTGDFNQTGYIVFRHLYLESLGYKLTCEVDGFCSERQGSTTFYAKN